MRNGTSDHKKPRWGAVRRCLCAVLMLASLITGMIPVAAAEREQPEIAVDLLGGSEGYSAVLYNNTNGLPTSEANTIAETSDGFLWIGSYGGLVRYDGKNFERIDSTTTGISSVVSLFVDSKDRLWIGTNDSGVAVMGKGSLRVYNKGDGLRSLFVRAVVEDQSGGIYIATTQGVVAVNDDMTLRQVDEPQISNVYVHDLDVGAGNVIYGRTTDGAVFTMEDGKLTGYYDGAKLGIGGIHCVSPDRDKAGYVYLGTTESEVYYGKLDGGADHMERIDISPLEYTNEIFHYGDQLWICADNGIGVVTPDGLTVLDELPMNSSVERILTDYQGNLWFTSSKQGVMKVVPNQFSDLFGQYGLKGEVVNATCIYDGRIFVGTKKSGLIVLDEEGVVAELPLTSAVTAGGKTVEETDLIRMLHGSQIRSIIRDSRNRLWLSVYGKYPLIRYDGRTAVCFTVADGIPTERVRTVVERQSGDFMAACTGGLALIEGDRVTEVYKEDSGIRNTEVLTCTEAENGDMILGTDGDGLYVISGSKVTHLGLDDGLSSEVVMRVKKDRTRDLYWLVTSNSIAYMSPDYQITTVKQFPYANNFDLYENSHDEMWVISSNGIYETSVQALLANGEVSAVLYDRQNGLPCIGTANSYSELTEDGTLYMAGATGVAKVNIETPFESVTSVKMSVPYVEVDGVRTYPDGSGVITIPPDAAKMTVFPYVFT